jgi:hypothetical protein
MLKTTLAASLAALLATGALAQPTLAEGEALAPEQTFTYNVIDEIVTLDPAIVRSSTTPTSPATCSKG